MRTTKRKYKEEPKSTNTITETDQKECAALLKDAEKWIRIWETGS